ncbi:hypothetical protein D9757_004697 [Collybiopsis confluens]|uniref:H/ACA ribonucleoprotein complex non-core subunit NAF1 n=1 Tax=Collybiopsis confluens TaxID=2823264 RepID=A0A8H5HS05_9AGAR|nr:hypothetical protein D9757_004697 [Collybiopsis confluens]
MDSFQAPLTIAQDLLLIQSFVGAEEQGEKPTLISPDDIDSSGDSEDEIEAELVGKAEHGPVQMSSSSEESSESLDSDPDSDSDTSDDQDKKQKKDEDEAMDEEDSGPPPATSSYFTTRNEMSDVNITVPDIEEVGPEEQLEFVGHVLNIIDNVVIVEGLQIELARGASDRALDADTLLVFEDRKVLGYIFETFGPTTQPMYQIKFSPTSYPIDQEKVCISRKVYHIPRRSNFVFTRRIQAMKGSDASNMNDEEPAEHELEFSDDEAEAEHKRNLKKKRASSRPSSAVSSRQPTPTPSQMRDADMIDENYFMSNNAYDEIGPYDLNYDESLSRPVPVPYDDPYADEFETASAPSTSNSVTSTLSTSTSSVASALRPQRRSSGELRGRGRGKANYSQKNQNRRGRGRGGGYQSSGSSSHQQALPRGSTNGFSSTNGVLGGSSDAQPLPQLYPQYPISPVGQWPFQILNQSMSDYGATMPYYSAPSQRPPVQPHINPLFASRFGMGVGMGAFPSGSPVHSQPPHGYTGSFIPTEMSPKPSEGPETGS